MNETLAPWVQTQFKRTDPSPKFVGGLKIRLKTRARVPKYRWRVPLPLSWNGQYAACTVSTETGVLVLPCHGLVRSGVACFSSNRKSVIRTKYKPTPNTIETIKGTFTWELWVHLIQPEHQLGLNYELATLCKVSDHPVKSCNASTVAVSM
jgi:hypothetical protein